jgi:hypothetical protein
MSEDLWAIWESGRFVGPNRPITRAIISKTALEEWGETDFRTLLFSDSDLGVPSAADWSEIPNILHVNIGNKLGQDAATMNLTLLNQSQASASTDLDLTHANTEPIQGQPSRRDLRDLGEPGKYSFGRGTNTIGAENVSFTQWGHDVDAEWVDMLIPNRLVRTFQGYGTDGAVHPKDDEKLILTGTWLIDKVTLNADSTIAIECRDLAKLAIEQRLYPPIVPNDHYPLTFSADHTVTRYEVTSTPEIPGIPEIISPNLAYHPADGPVVV